MEDSLSISASRAAVRRLAPLEAQRTRANFHPPSDLLIGDEEVVALLKSQKPFARTTHLHAAVCRSLSNAPRRRGRSLEKAIELKRSLSRCPECFPPRAHAGDLAVEIRTWRWRSVTWRRRSVTRRGLCNVKAGWGRGRELGISKARGRHRVARREEELDSYAAALTGQHPSAWC